MNRSNSFIKSDAVGLLFCSIMSQGVGTEALSFNTEYTGNGNIAAQQQTSTLGKDELKHNLFNKVNRKFYSDLMLYPEITKGNEADILDYFRMSIDRVAKLDPDNVIFSFTRSNSLYFKIYKGSYKLNTEVFFDFDDTDSDDIEFICTAYRYEEKILSIATSLKEGFGKLSDIVMPRLVTIPLRSSTV